ncbi:MAG: hypothetical protein LBT40_07500 [Deltaproteobacteria bacterium]|jgi:hypothetical protein|nr:hypothetical protein [Deltaproteobacteria bacterium]
MSFDSKALEIIERAGTGRALLPESPFWTLKDGSGVTAAHVAAMHGKLPPGFGKWRLRDGDGVSAAETAAMHGNMPRGVAYWRQLIDEEGRKAGKG